MRLIPGGEARGLKNLAVSIRKVLSQEIAYTEVMELVEELSEVFEKGKVKSVEKLKMFEWALRAREDVIIAGGGDLLRLLDRRGVEVSFGVGDYDWGVAEDGALVPDSESDNDSDSDSEGDTDSA